MKCRLGAGMGPVRSFVPIHTREEKGQVRIGISHNSPEIPKANLQRIFDLFFTTKPANFEDLAAKPETARKRSDKQKEHPGRKGQGDYPYNDT